MRWISSFVDDYIVYIEEIKYKKYELNIEYVL